MICNIESGGDGSCCDDRIRLTWGMSFSDLNFHFLKVGLVLLVIVAGSDCWDEEVRRFLSSPTTVSHALMEVLVGASLRPVLNIRYTEMLSLVFPVASIPPSRNLK